MKFRITRSLSRKKRKDKTRNLIKKTTIYKVTLIKQKKKNHRTPLVQCSLHKYKCLWGMGIRTGIQVSKRKLHKHKHLN